LGLLCFDLSLSLNRVAVNSIAHFIVLYGRGSWNLGYELYIELAQLFTRHSIDISREAHIQN